MTTQTLDLNNIERKIFWVLVSLVGVAIGFYLYSVLALTVAGVERDRLSRSSHALATMTGDIEAEYLAQSNEITLLHAQELGFHEVNAKFAGLSTIVEATAGLSSGVAEKLSIAR